ncbi:MAG TPA: energy transducer TonB [Candidatus Odoribacter faecigallinarum]|uniref:Energy transducer TonB n=1 Tax=Candidatus Odoribacter faecigallinarum TaxID=2838706 RepID=A0A9D2AAR0_9BACT|nr:energy transducer TonB [Candidatus Odoribacter faecigallinarum]
MKKLLPLLMIIFITSYLSQVHGATVFPKDEDKIYTTVDFPAQFQGSSLETWLADNIKYSKEMINDNLQGKVIVECIIEKNGKISTPRIIESPHDALSKEALRLINKMPKWSPAKWEGKDVASLHHISLRFHPFKPTYVVSEKSRFEGKETPRNMADPSLTRLPIFSEGNPQLWIARHVHYPATAITQGLTGRVYVSFVIDTDGSVCDVAIQKGVHPALDMAAYRAVCSMPKWFPGMSDGKIVRVRHTLPINFQFSREKSIGPKTSAPRFPHQSFPHNR